MEQFNSRNFCNPTVYINHIRGVLAVPFARKCGVAQRARSRPRRSKTARRHICTPKPSSVVMSFYFLRTPIISPLDPRVQLAIFLVSVLQTFFPSSIHARFVILCLLCTSHNRSLTSILFSRLFSRLPPSLLSTSAFCTSFSRSLVLQASH